MKIAIVTGSDEAYFPLLQGLLSSIRAQAPSPADFDLFVLDGGLSETSRAWVGAHGVDLVEIGWALPETLFRRRLYRILVNKPFLPLVVPGYDLYLWIDADAWVQDWEAVRLLVAAATQHGLAAVPEADRAYVEGHGKLPTQLVRSSVQARSVWLKAGFGDEITREVYLHPTVNVGVFAALRDSRLWDIWGDLYREAVARDPAMPEGYRFMMEQTSFNVALLKHIRNFARLPAWCNWTCLQALPVMVPGGELLEAGYPHRRLGIVHPVGETKNLKINLRGKDGAVEQRHLRYPGPIDETSAPSGESGLVPGP